MEHFLIAFLLIFVYKCVKNLFCFLRIKALDKKHILWLSQQGCSDFQTYKSECLRLLKSAGVKDASIPTTQPMGYGQFASFSSSVFLNFPTRIQVYAGAVMGMFDEAIGEYRRRIFETFNPLYWIDCILFLPRNLLDYLGLDNDKAVYKLLNIILSAVWWLVGIALTLFNDEVKSVIINLTKVIP